MIKISVRNSLNYKRTLSLNFGIFSEFWDFFRIFHGLAIPKIRRFPLGFAHNRYHLVAMRSAICEKRHKIKGETADFWDCQSMKNTKKKTEIPKKPKIPKNPKIQRQCPLVIQ